MKVEREIGRMPGKTTRAAKLFDVKVTKTDKGVPRVARSKIEAAFRIHKSDLSIRPTWQQKEERVLAHIFICFPACNAIAESMVIHRSQSPAANGSYIWWNLSRHWFAEQRQDPASRAGNE